MPTTRKPAGTPPAAKQSKRIDWTAHVIHLVMTVATVGTGYIATSAKTAEQVSEQNRRIETLEAQKGSETRLIVDNHTKQIEKVQEDVTKLRDTLNDVKTDTTIIKEWVTEQKQRKANQP